LETAQARKETEEGREMMRRNGEGSLSHKVTTHILLRDGWLSDESEQEETSLQPNKKYTKTTKRSTGIVI
jgi:hypothetical protein